MAKLNSEVFAVRRYDQLAALCSPVRQELVDAFAALGPAPVAEVAAHLGRTPESLYFHVRKLVATGLLLEDGTRPRGRRHETLYRTPARRMVLSLEPMTSRRRQALIDIVHASLRLVPRDVERGMRVDDAVMCGSDRTVYSTRMEGWLTPKRRARLAQLFDEIEALMAEAHPEPGADLASVSLTLAPRPARQSPRSRPPRASAPENAE